MNILKLTIAAAISGLFVGVGSVAYAEVPVPPTYTYVFTANSDAGDTSFDGSSITISNDIIIGWDLKDNAHGPGGALIEEIAGIGNSHIYAQNVTSYNSTTWDGSFTIQNYYQSAITSVETPDAFYGDSDGTLASNGGYLYDDYAPDPNGYWSTQAAVPDALNSFQLFALALAALAASRLFFRNQTPVRVRN